MTGVEILNEYVVASPSAFSWVTLGIILSVFVIYGIFFWMIETDPKYFIFSIIVGVLFGTIGGCFVGTNSPTGDDAITRYEVMIDDSVSMNDFYEKYEIIDQKGKIFIVEEKK